MLQIPQGIPLFGGGPPTNLFLKWQSIATNKNTGSALSCHVTKFACMQHTCPPTHPPTPPANGHSRTQAEHTHLPTRPFTLPAPAPAATQANDGVCDEARCAWGDCLLPAGKIVNPAGSEVYQLKCDLGTDCNDCGPWKGHHVDRKSWCVRKGGVSVRVRCVCVRCVRAGEGSGGGCCDGVFLGGQGYTLGFRVQGHVRNSL